MGTSVSPLLKGDGVAKDAAHAVFLLRKAAEQDDQMRADAQTRLAECYATGEGVEADTAQAAVWCQKAAKSGFEPAIEFLPIIRRCDFCGATPARQLCKRCMKARYCGVACIQGHWIRAADPHKDHCRRRAAEASHAEAGGTFKTSTSEGRALGDCSVIRAWREGCPELCELWDETAPMTAWEGINDFGDMGGAEAGRVVVIHLDHEGLTGEVPAAFGGLTGRGLPTEFFHVPQMAVANS